MGIKMKRNVLFIIPLLVLSITCGCAKGDSLTDNANQINTETPTEVENDTSSETNSETENNSSVDKDNVNTGQTSSKQELRPGENGEYRVTVVERDWYTVTDHPPKEGFVQIKVNDRNQLLEFGSTRMACDYKDMYGAQYMGNWHISLHCDCTVYGIVADPAPCFIDKSDTEVPYCMTEGLTQ